MSNDLIKASIAELIGTFVLVFIGAFAVASLGDDSNIIPSNADVIVPALAHGLVLIGIIAMYGHISGAHVNPAVTVALLIGGKVDTIKAGAYIVAQFVGGILAGLLLSIILESSDNMGITFGSLTEDKVWSAALFEAILTFFLVSTVYQAAAYGKAGNLAGVAIGFTLAGCILAGGTYTGASLNPARTLGPALFDGNFDYVIPYFVGIFGGGALASLLHTYFFNEEEK